jgi:L-iditol 2-dehydrogenase
VKAVQVSAPGVARVIDVPTPEPASGEVLVHVVEAAICSTDVKFTARGADPARVPGHEVAGTLSDGTAVGVHPDIGCGRCRWCRAGFSNRCPRRVSVGLDRDGGLAEVVVVPAEHAVPLDGIALDIAPLLEPLACCVHAVELTGVQRGEPALVVGAGPMGLLCMWALQAVGALAAVCQRSVERRTIAEKLGADVVLGPDEDPSDLLGREPRTAIVTAPGGEPLEWAARRVGVGAVVHVFAGSPGGAPIDANLVHYRHLHLLGSTGSTLADYRRAIQLVREGVVDLHALPRESLSLDAVPHVLAARSKGLLKQMVRVGGEMA